MKLLAIITCCILALVAIFTPWRSKPEPFVTIQDSTRTAHVRGGNITVLTDQYEDTLVLRCMRGEPGYMRRDSVQIFFYPRLSIKLWKPYEAITVLVRDSSDRTVPISPAMEQLIIKKLWR